MFLELNMEIVITLELKLLPLMIQITNQKKRKNVADKYDYL